LEDFIPSIHDLIMSGQILLSLLLGGVIGFEREARNKPAGLRTHMMVAAGTTAFTLASIYGFSMVSGQITRDPARVAAQIVSGIGFLGAGTIFRSGSSIRGLTTASTIWLVASIGMLVGVGMYWLAIFTTVISTVVLSFMPAPIYKLERRLRVGEPSITPDDDEEL